MPLTLPSFHWKIEEKFVFFLKCNKYFKVIVVVHSFLPPPPPPPLLPPQFNAQPQYGNYKSDLEFQIDTAFKFETGKSGYDFYA